MNDERQADLTIPLKFRPQSAFGHVDDPLHKDISAIAIHGNTLFCSCDETSSVERLVYDAEEEAFTDHRSFRLGDVFDLPGGPDGEMDIEGLGLYGEELWVTGSHSLKRDTPDDGDFDELHDIDWDENRSFLGKVPLLIGDGPAEPVGVIDRFGEDPRMARHLPFKSDDGYLRGLLRDDELIGRFIDIPCKENGFDIEGLAARGNTVWLGLRGPVIGAHALLVEMQMKVTKAGHLKPAKREDGKRYRLIALNLKGQAVRDLFYDEEGERLLVLSGATTDLEALQTVYEIKDWPRQEDVILAEDINPLVRLPTIRGRDHAEGIAFFEKDGEAMLMVVHDSPEGGRVDDDGKELVADLYKL